MSNWTRCAGVLALACGALAQAQIGTITTYAGNGGSGAPGNGIPAGSAYLTNPAGLALDANGNLYIAVSTAGVVQKVDAATGIITIVAGGGVGGDGGPATSAQLTGPCDVKVDAGGNLYIAETCEVTQGGGNGGGGGTGGIARIRRVDAVTGIITTIAGNPVGGSGFGGDGGPATASLLNLPAGLALDSAGDIFIADSGNNRIREINAATGIIATIAGNGVAAYAGDGGLAASASLNQPAGVAVDSSGNLYIADTGNNAIRVVNAATGIITTLAGTGAAGFNGDGVPAVTATLNGPCAIAFNSAGNLVFTDLLNNRVRLIDASGLIWTVAGDGLSGGNPNGDNGPASLAELAGPLGVAALPSGPLFVSELLGDRVRQDALPSSTAATAVTVTASANPTPQGAPVTLTASIAASNGQASSAGGGFYFFDGTTLIGEVAIGNGSASMTTSTLPLGINNITAGYSGSSGFGGSYSPVLALNVTSQPSSIVLAANPNPAQANQPVILSATVSPSSATGAVTFYRGATALGSASISQGSASLTVAAGFAAGNYSLTAQYSGDSNYGPSTSPALPLTVAAASSVTLSSSANPSTAGQAVTLTASVTPASATGTVQFMDGSNSIGTAPVASGVATLAASSLAAGQHSLTAVYSGDVNDLPATSAVLSQSVLAASSVTVASTQNPGYVGTPVGLSAAVAPSTATGTIQFLDGGTVLATVTISGGSAFFSTSSLAQGTHSITAVYSGDASDSAAVSAVLTQVMKQSAGMTTGMSPNPAVVGQTVTLTASLASAATGTVTFSDNGSTLAVVNVAAGTASYSTSSLSTGSHSIGFSYSGDANYMSQAATFPLTILNASSTALVSSANPSVTGANVTFTATVTPSSATGAIQFYASGNLVATVTLSSGAAAYSTSSLPPGNDLIVAIYNGDSTHGSSTATLMQLVRSSAGLTTGISPSPAVAGQTVTLTATVNAAATGTVTFTDGGATLAVVTVSSGRAAFSTSSLTPGAHTIGFNYSGDSTYAAASATAPETVLAVSTVALNSSLNPSTAGQTVAFTATVTPASATGAVQFLDGSTVIGSAALAAGRAAFSTGSLASGSHSITASYAGDANDAPASSGSLAQVVNLPPPNPPSNLSAASISSTQINLAWTASSTGGVTYNVYGSTVSGFLPSPSNRIASGLGATAFPVTGLAPGTTYYFLVTAVNAGGESAPANQASAATANVTACHVTYQVTSQSSRNFTGAFSIKNTGTTTFTSWALTWTWAGNQKVTSASNAKQSQSGPNVTMANESYNATIAPGATLSGMTFTANYRGTNTSPSAFAVNGVPCQ